MSLDHPNAAPSATPDTEDPYLADLVRRRGEDLIDALDKHCPGAAAHAQGTGSYAFAAAVGLGIDRSGSELCREAAKLHDVGKVYVPRQVLAKRQTEMTAEELIQLESHYEAGAQLALGAGIPEEVCDWILHTREHYDGSGPEGLAGDEIPVAARITRAACACDQLLANGVPSHAGIHERSRAAVTGLRSRSRKDLDPTVVMALTSILTEAR